MIVMSREQFLATSGVQGHRLEFWLEQAWLIPTTTATGSGYTDREVARARLIQDLEGPLGVNAEGVDLVLHLVDQIHGMRQAMASLRERMGAAPDDPSSSGPA